MFVISRWITSSVCNSISFRVIYRIKLFNLTSREDIRGRYCNYPEEESSPILLRMLSGQTSEFSFKDMIPDTFYRVSVSAVVGGVLSPPATLSSSPLVPASPPTLAPKNASGQPD